MSTTDCFQCQHSWQCYARPVPHCNSEILFFAHGSIPQRLVCQFTKLNKVYSSDAAVLLAKATPHSSYGVGMTDLVIPTSWGWQPHDATDVVLGKTIVVFSADWYYVFENCRIISMTRSWDICNKLRGGEFLSDLIIASMTAVQAGHC